MSDWYQQLVDEVQTHITETVFASRWSLVEGYHKLGGMLTKAKKDHGPGVVSDLSQDLGKHKRTLYRCIRFVEKFPRLDDIPEGKNISWNKILTLHLPENTKKEKSELQKRKERIREFISNIQPRDHIFNLQNFETKIEKLLLEYEDYKRIRR